MIREHAPAKVNLVLRIGPRQRNGLHQVASLFASLDLEDEVEVEVASEDSVECPGVDGPNLAERAVQLIRGYAPWIPPLRIRITKRIPVAAGLAGGSADAAAALRAANSFQEVPFDDDHLRAIAAALGSDVPSQVAPAHCVVTGTGERVERVRLPDMAVVLVPSGLGIATADVFRKADHMKLPREQIGAADLHELAKAPLDVIAASLENDLQAATLRLRPELTGAIQALLDAGALGAQVSGSGPTVFGVFADESAASAAADAIPGSLLTKVAQQ